MTDTPWLTAKEAAEYCRMGLRTFNRFAVAKGLRQDGGAGKRLYKARTLDRFLEVLRDQPRQRKAS